MDPGTYISIAGATWEFVQICNVLKDALRGHEASQKTLEELEQLVRSISQTLDSSSRAPPPLLNIITELEKYHKDYQSAGQPGKRLSQIFNRVRLVINEDGLNKKYDRLMRQVSAWQLVMMNDIYAEIKLAGAATPLPTDNTALSFEGNTPPERTNTGFSGTTLLSTSPTQRGDSTRSFMARMKKSLRATGPSEFGEPVRRALSMDFSDEIDKFQREQVYKPPTVRHPSAGAESRGMLPVSLLPTPSPTGEGFSFFPPDMSPSESRDWSREPAVPTGRPPEPTIVSERRIPSPPADQPQRTWSTPIVVVREASDPAALAVEPSRASAELYSRPKVFNAGHVTVTTTTSLPLDLANARYTVEDFEEDKLLTMWDGETKICHRIPADVTGIPYTRVPFEKPWKTMEVSFLLPQGSSHDVSIQQPGQIRAATVPGRVVYKIHGSDSRPGKPSRSRLLFEQRLRNCPQLRVFKCGEVTLFLSHAKEITTSVYVKLWTTQSWEGGSRLVSPTLSFARRHELQEEIPISAFEKVLGVAATNDSTHVWRLSMRSNAYRLALTGRKGPDLTRRLSDVQHPSSGTSSGGSVSIRSGYSESYARRLSAQSLETESTGHDGGKKSSGSSCSAIELKFEKHLGIEFQNAWNHLWTTINKESMSSSVLSSSANSFVSDASSTRTFSPELSRSPPSSTAPRPMLSPRQMARIEEEMESDPHMPGTDLTLPEGVLEGTSFRPASMSRVTRRR